MTNTREKNNSSSGDPSSDAPFDVASDAVARDGVSNTRAAAKESSARRNRRRRTSRAMLRASLEERTDELQTASQLAVRLHETLGQRQRQIVAMHRVSEAMFQRLDADAMARQTLDIALEVLDAQAGSLQLYDPDNDTLEFQYVVGPTADTLTGYVMPASQGISGQVLRTGLPDTTRHIREHGGFNPMLDQKGGHRAEAMATVPLKRSGGYPIGVMQMIKVSDAGFDRGDLEVLQVLCAQAAAAIETARLAQQARQAEIVNVLGDISHDIKNMLTPIQTGVLTLLPILDETFQALEDLGARPLSTHEEGEESWRERLKQITSLARDDYRWILENALESADKVQTRTSEIANAVKGEIAPPLFEAGDLNEIVGEVARPLFLLADKTNVHLHIDIDHALPQSEFDRKQMYNALYNLVNNAIPETPGGGSVTIRTRGPGAGQSTVLLEVEDTGRGIPEHVRARLFTDEAISTKAGGTGLGTRIVADVVRRHNGSIQVQSELGQGTTFSIRLPLRHETGMAVEVAAQRLPARRHNLPPLAADLIGRESERSLTCQLLRGNDARLLSLTGTGGIGKTRLALQVAHDVLDDFPDGVWFVSLAPVSDLAMTASVLAATLGVREERGRPLHETLQGYLRPRRLLLVLDNFEQILEAAPAISGLLDECGGLRVLVTSRSALNLSGEREIALPPLQSPALERVPQARNLSDAEVAEWGRYAAIALFVERTMQTKPDFALTPDNARDVAEICARLDGLPLAIELAAAQSGVLMPHEIRARLAGRLGLLETELPRREHGVVAREVPARHQTLRAAIDWSHDLLRPPEQQLLRRMVVFEGGCTPEAARLVCDGEADVDVAQGLSQLVNTGLLRQSRRHDGEPWFWMLQTIREYGLEKLERAGESPMMRRRHAKYYLAVAQSAQGQRIRSLLAGPPLPGVPSADATAAAWSDWRKREDDNLRAALFWLLDNADTQPVTAHSENEQAQDEQAQDEQAQDEQAQDEQAQDEQAQDERVAHGGLRLSLALRDVWVGDHWNERREALRRALEKSETAPAEMRLKAMLYVGDLACLQADFERAEEFGQKSLELSRQIGNRWAVARALGILANVASERGDLRDARFLHEESLVIFQKETGNRGAAAWTLYHLGIVAKRSRDGATARDFFERSLTAFREMDDRGGVAWSLYNLGIGVYRRDDPAPARQNLEECLAIFRDIENKSGIAWSLSFLGKMAGHERDFPTARAFLDESLELARQLGDRWNVAATLWNLGDVSLAQNDQAGARDLFREVTTMLQAMNNGASLRALLRSFARLAVAQGQMESVARLLGTYDALSENPNENWAETISTETASLAEDTGQRREAVLARGVLGEVAFAALWEQGRALTLQQAFDECLRL
jgi:predicted ATPase/signal transduction histidine kinase